MLDWLAGLYVNVAEPHPVHARQVLLRGSRDGSHRHRCAPHLRHRHRRLLPRGRLPERHQVRQGQGLRDENGIVADFEIEGDFPKYGNDDDRADEIAVWLLQTFLEKIKKRHTYRNSEPTTSILTITSNVVYGK